MDEETLWHWFVSSLCSCPKKYLETEQFKSKSWSNFQYVIWLVHSFRPDLISTKELVNNAEHDPIQLLKSLEDKLGIPVLLDKSEINKAIDVDEHDDLPFLTYVALIHTLFEKSKPSCSSSSIRQDHGELSNKPALNIPVQHFLWCRGCQKDVTILERFCVEEFMLHRKCFTCQRCQKTLHIGLYQRTKDGYAFECSEHEKDDLVKKLTAEQSTASVPKDADPINEIKTETVTTEEIKKLEEQSKKEDKISKEDNVEDVASNLYPKIVADIDDAIKCTLNNGDEDISKPTAPPRKKKQETKEGGAGVFKPLPAVRTKLKGKADEAVCVYPIEKNPFGGEDDENDFVVVRRNKLRVDDEQRKAKAVSTNPFGSDDEFDDSASSLSSENPFNDSDYDSEMSGVNRRRSLMSTDNHTSRVMTKSYTPGVAIDSLSVQDSLRSNSRSPSNSTLTKKRPAPLPPPKPANLTSNKKTTEPKKTQSRKKRPAPPPPLPFRRQIRSEITLNSEELGSNLRAVEAELQLLEEKSRLLEGEIRKLSSNSENDAVKKFLIQNWISLVHERMEVVRRENEFSFLLRERQLDELHSEIEFRLRCIIEKPESEKRNDDGQREAYLLQKLLKVIDEKSLLAESGVTESTPFKQSNSDDSNLFADDGASAEKKVDEKSTKKKKHIKFRLKKLKKKLISSG